MGVMGRIRTLFRLFLLFTVLVAVTLVSAITTIRISIHGHQETMPNLVGLPIGTAQRIGSGLGLEVKIEDKLYSDKYPANQIVSQVPPAGTRVKVGQHVHVLVSLGVQRVIVPDLTNASVRAAQITAVQRGLAVGDVATVYWPGQAEDTIIAQEPPPSTTQAHSPVLNLLVSTSEPLKAYVCPNFIGMPLAEARRVIEDAGFHVGKVTTLSQPGSRSGMVVAQAPAAGSKISVGSSLELQVAE